jgi:hypothetical protein
MDPNQQTPLWLQILQGMGGASPQPGAQGAPGVPPVGQMRPMGGPNANGMGAAQQIGSLVGGAAGAIGKALGPRPAPQVPLNNIGATPQTLSNNLPNGMPAPQPGAQTDLGTTIGDGMQPPIQPFAYGGFAGQDRTFANPQGGFAGGQDGRQGGFQPGFGGRQGFGGAYRPVMSAAPQGSVNPPAPTLQGAAPQQMSPQQAAARYQPVPQPAAMPMQPPALQAQAYAPTQPAQPAPQQQMGAPQGFQNFGGGYGQGGPNVGGNMNTTNLVGAGGGGGAAPAAKAFARGGSIVPAGIPAAEPAEAEAGMRRYSPIGPRNPTAQLQPKPEDMSHRLPTRIPVTPRLNVRLPRPKMPGAGGVGFGRG